LNLFNVSSDLETARLIVGVPATNVGAHDGSDVEVGPNQVRRLQARLNVFEVALVDLLPVLPARGLAALHEDWVAGLSNLSVACSLATLELDVASNSRAPVANGRPSHDVRLHEGPLGVVVQSRSTQLLELLDSLRAVFPDPRIEGAEEPWNELVRSCVCVRAVATTETVERALRKRDNLQVRVLGQVSTTEHLLRGEHSELTIPDTGDNEAVTHESHDRAVVSLVNALTVAMVCYHDLVDDTLNQLLELRDIVEQISVDSNGIPLQLLDRTTTVLTSIQGDARPALVVSASSEQECRDDILSLVLLVLTEDAAVVHVVRKLRRLCVRVEPLELNQNVGSITRNVALA